MCPRFANPQGDCALAAMFGREEILENLPPSARAPAAALMQSAKKELTCTGESCRLCPGVVSVRLAAQTPTCALTSGGRGRVEETKFKIRRNRGEKPKQSFLLLPPQKWKAMMKSN